MTRPLRITLIAVVVALLAFVGGPWIYINVFRDDAPAPLVGTTVPADTAVDTTVADTVPAAVTDVSGTWTIGPGSVVGYRVEEILFGQNVTAVGRTSAVTGSLTFENDSLTAASFTLDAPIALPSGAVDGAPVTLDAIGSLTLRGTTKSVTIPLTATLTPSGIDVRGEYEVVFADWQIPDPSLPGISTEDRGILEFRLLATR